MLKFTKHIAFGLCLWATACTTTPVVTDSAMSTDTVVVATDSLQLVWSDEFDIDGLPDTTKWSYNTGGDGWGNRELQYYTANRPENARVENGLLIIETRRELYQKMKYTSARLVTKNKGDWQYGRFEIRAKVPAGRGTWSAIWMLPTTWDLGNGSWPDCGEIDIMEHVGHVPDTIYRTIHCNAFNHAMHTQKGKAIAVPDAENEFHIYTLDWNAERLEISVDNEPPFTIEATDKWEEWPFFRPFHLVLNTAVGGFWGGANGIDDSIFPQRMEIDYVRVYQ